MQDENSNGKGSQHFIKNWRVFNGLCVGQNIIFQLLESKYEYKVIEYYLPFQYKKKIITATKETVNLNLRVMEDTHSGPPLSFSLSSSVKTPPMKISLILSIRLTLAILNI